MFEANQLSLAIWLPIIGGIAVLATGNDQRAGLARIMALLVSIAAFLATLPLYTGFDISTGDMQFIEHLPWIPALNINYSLAIDGIALLLILLTAFITIIVVISAWQVIQEKVAQYMAAFLIMEGLMIGVFSATDAILFYVFWEAMLIPMFLIIGIWGGPNRIYATIKFFLYTLLGSLLMLVALIYLYIKSGNSFALADMYAVKLGLTEQIWLFIAFFSAFAVKIPMFPVHTWLPDAHVEAPTGGSVVLAAIMLKMGAYGFIRFNLPITPDASHSLSTVIIVLSLIAIVYISLVALAQTDMKKLIAYSSIAHMGFVTLGLFVFNKMALEGAIIQIISHGFISGAMFLCVGVLYDRMHTRNMSDYGGVANTMPKFAAFMMFFAMANVGLPGTSGFVGEFLVILGVFQVNAWYAIIAGTILILGAAYTLWMFKKTIYGAVNNDMVKALKDINSREGLFLLILTLSVLIMGLWPAPFLEIIHTSVDRLLTLSAVTKL
ncbi:MAG: NADH-quinone oxidoreductase subunit M [Gammaproteobacteria bacterium]|nr:MAG: NADH-quinone oxidoreductase subunit M [Gammaproteobacteria bacterium]